MTPSKRWRGRGVSSSGDDEEEDMLRRVAVLAAGLATTASVGLAGAGAASAASPALHIVAGSRWTVEVTQGNGCEVAHFEANHTFWVHPVGNGDVGTWSGGGKSITLTWTSGPDTGTIFEGTFHTTPIEQYVGTYSFTGGSSPGELVKGHAANCR
jgi:hypothetical protein